MAVASGLFTDLKAIKKELLGASAACRERGLLQAGKWPNDSRMLVALGECYEKLNQLVEAKKESVEHQEVSTAFRYLAQYYFKCKLLDEASACAQKCFSFNDTREEGKALLRQILQLRNQGDSGAAESSSAAPFFLPQPLSATNTPTRRVSPLNLSSVTP